MMIAKPLLLYLAPLIVLAIAALAWHARRRRIRAAAAWSPALASEAVAIGRRSVVVLALVALAAAVGLAGPRWGMASRATESRALNVVLVMDVSKSMLAADVAPNRLGRATGIARRLVQDLAGDRLGLVAFAARGYLLAPLTMDQSALLLQLDALDPDIASEGGSNLPQALDQARAVLQRAAEGGDRAVIVFSDGESFDGTAPLAAAGKALRDAGVTLVAVGVGEPEGSQIPDGNGGFVTDELGAPVLTVRRDDLLHAVVDAAGGVLVPADAVDPSGEVRRVLGQLHRASARDRMAADYVPRAWLFALLAAALLLLHSVTRRSAALASIAMMIAGASPLAAQRPSAGSQYLQRGDTVRALAAFLADAKRTGSDTAWFNAGTAALARGDIADAVESLQRATTSLDPGLRKRALYNLGTAQLVGARRDSTRRDSLLTAATASLQAALLLDPSDQNAKWNYELARRQQRPPPPSSGGGGGGGKDGSPEAPKSPPKSGMSEAEAEQVLSAMERAERETRQSQWRRQRRGAPPAGPDW